MRAQKSPYRDLETKVKAAEELIHVLRTRQVDAIVGKRHVMLVRLKQAEDNLKSSRNQLRALVAHLLSVREKERIVIARELHDEFGQALTSLQLGLHWLSRQLTREQGPLQDRITSLSATTTSLIRSVKNVAGELRPGVVDELGLVRTLESEAREFERHTGIPCGFTTNMARVQFDRGAAVAVFRIVQAALTNVTRHAQASRVRIRLMKSRNDLTLTVMDNGKGIARTSIHSHDSIGISGMRERTLALGGTFTLVGSRSKGTVLTVRMALSRVLLGTASNSLPT